MLWGAGPGRWLQVRARPERTGVPLSSPDLRACRLPRLFSMLVASRGQTDTPVLTCPPSWPRGRLPGGGRLTPWTWGNRAGGASPVSDSWPARCWPPAALCRQLDRRLPTGPGHAARAARLLVSLPLFPGARSHVHPEPSAAGKGGGVPGAPGPRVTVASVGGKPEAAVHSSPSPSSSPWPEAASSTGETEAWSGGEASQPVPRPRGDTRAARPRF